MFSSSINNLQLHHFSEARNIEGHLSAKSPSAAVIPMTLDCWINTSGSLSNSSNNVGLICDDKRICAIENQWEVDSVARYRPCFPSNLTHIVGSGRQLISANGPSPIFNTAAIINAQIWGLVVSISWEQNICPLFTAKAACFLPPFTNGALPQLPQGWSQLNYPAKGD